MAHLLPDAAAREGFSAATPYTCCGGRIVLAQHFLALRLGATPPRSPRLAAQTRAASGQHVSTLANSAIVPAETAVCRVPS